MKLLQRDLDKALAQPWSTHSCLLQQALIRRNGKPDDSFPPENPAFHDRGLAHELMDIFDSSHTKAFTENESLTGIALLRAMLPMEV